MKKYIALLAMFFAISCIEPPAAPLADDFLTGETGVFILSEGLWGSDNSTLARIDLSSGQINQDYFGSANPTMRLGDIASDLVIKGDTVFVAVSTSSTIEVFSKINGKSFGRIFLPENSQPRKIIIIDDSTAYVTLLFKNTIAKFNPRNFELSPELIETGPFPEGMAALGEKLFVANSGYGDYFYKLPKAGTISVIDQNSGVEIAAVPCGNNPIEVIASTKRNRIYAAYYNLPSLVDSLGGIVEYDPLSFRETRRWRLRATDITLSVSQDTLFFLAGNTESIGGVFFIDLNADSIEPQLLIQNTNSKQIWYSLAQSPDKSQIWVGNAGRFQSSGELYIFPNVKDSVPIRKFMLGTNPNKIVFF